MKRDGAKENEKIIQTKRKYRNETRVKERKGREKKEIETR